MNRSLAILGRVLAAASLLLLSAGALLADIVHMKDGRQIEGEVVEDTAREIVIKTRFGRQTLPKAEVRRVEKKESPSAIFKKKRAELDPADSGQILSLAQWAKDNKLYRESNDLYKLVLSVDADNETAHRALNHIKYKDAWYTEAELAKITEAENRAKGLVKHKGEWVSREDKEKIEKGYKKVDGQWVSPEQALQDRGMIKVEGKWVKRDDYEKKRLADKVELALGETPAVELTDRFAIVTLDEEERTHQMGEWAEECQSWISSTLDDKPDKSFWIGRGLIYIINNQNSYDDFCTDILPEYIADEEMRRLARGGGVTSSGDNPPFGCTFLESKYEFNPHISHKVAHYAMTHFVGGRIPPWLSEGWASYVDFQMSKDSLVRCSTKTSYGNRGGEIAEKAGEAKNWKSLLKETILEGEADPEYGPDPIDKMKVLNLNSLDLLHLSMAYSIVDYLMSTQKDKFIKFLRALRSTNQDDAFQAAFGKSLAEFEVEWKEYVKQNY